MGQASLGSYTAGINVRKGLDVLVNPDVTGEVDRRTRSMPSGARRRSGRVRPLLGRAMCRAV